MKYDIAPLASSIVASQGTSTHTTVSEYAAGSYMALFCSR